MHKKHRSEAINIKLGEKSERKALVKYAEARTGRDRWSYDGRQIKVEEGKKD